jgi:hypothetical protein
MLDPSSVHSFGHGVCCCGDVERVEECCRANQPIRLHYVVHQPMRLRCVLQAWDRNASHARCDSLRVRSRRSYSEK